MDYAKMLKQKNVFREDTFIPGAAYMIRINKESLARKMAEEIIMCPIATRFVDNSKDIDKRIDVMAEKLMQGVTAIFDRINEYDGSAGFVVYDGKEFGSLLLRVEYIEDSISSEAAICTPPVAVMEMCVIGIDVSSTS